MKRRREDADQDIARLREEIDALDHRLLEILNSRLSLAREIGARKASTGAPVFVAPREKTVLARLLASNRGPFPAGSLLRVYREIFSASRRAERPLSACHVGAPGSLGHAAAASLFGEATELHALLSTRAVLRVVARDEVDYGVLPSLDAPEGVGTHALLHLLEFDLHLVAEYYLPLDLGIALPGKRKAVRRVLVAPAFRELAAERLPAQMPEVELEPVESTAAAARRCRERRGDAALVPSFTARKEGLRVVRRVLGVGEGRRLRYLVAASRPAAPTGADKTTIAFGIANRTGNLIRALEPFSRRRVNLSLLTTSPAALGPAEDRFFLDFEGHQESEAIRQTLGEMAEVCSFVRVLGSYPVFDWRAGAG